jgi:hypothetical protein
VLCTIWYSWHAWRKVWTICFSPILALQFSVVAVTDTTENYNAKKWVIWKVLAGNNGKNLSTNRYC